MEPQQGSQETASGTWNKSGRFPERRNRAAGAEPRAHSECFSLLHLGYRCAEKGPEISRKPPKSKKQRTMLLYPSAVLYLYCYNVPFLFSSLSQCSKTLWTVKFFQALSNGGRLTAESLLTWLPFLSRAFFFPLYFSTALSANCESQLSRRRRRHY